MANIIISLPLQTALFEYAYWDGGNFTDDVLMNGGAAWPSKTFSSPDTTNLRFTVTPPSPVDVSYFHFSSLSIHESLVFEIYVDGALYHTSNMPAVALPRLRRDYTIRFPLITVNTNIQVYISNLNAPSLDFDQMVLGKDDWQPYHNFSDETPPENPTRYNRRRTRQTNQQRIDDATRIFNLDFWNSTQEEFDELEHIVNVLSSNGYMFVDINPDSTNPKHSFLAYVQLQEFASHGDIKKFQAQLIEANVK